MVTTLIKKHSNFSYWDMIDYEEKRGSLEPIGNAFAFTSKFYNSPDQNRISKNPFNIPYEKMFKTFGIPNFIDQYKDDFWWILIHNDKLFAVSTHSIEGSEIYQFLTHFSHKSVFETDIEDFYNQLFNQI